VPDLLSVLVQQSLNGIVLGCLYVLVALGLTLIYGVMNQINFAHADFVTLGAFAAYFFTQWLGGGYVLSIGVAFAAGAVLGVLVNAAIFAPLRERGDELRPLVATIGVSVLLENGALALLFVSIGIVLYLWLRFEWKFGVSAIIANLHDIVIILGMFSIFQWEFSLPVLAAVLAILGYSVNESVVVMDRVRETFRNRKMRSMPVPQIIDHAITATISRTVITHGCTQLMVCSMLIFGGETLFYFALALTIGICFGIYSSVLVASPLVMWLGVDRSQFVRPQKKARGKDEHEGAVV